MTSLISTMPSPTLRGIFEQVLRHHYGLVVVWVAAILASAGLMLALPMAVRYAIDGSSMPSAVIALSVIIAGLAVATAGRYIAAHRLGDRVATTVRQRLFDHLLRQELALFQTTPTGDLTSRLNSDTDHLRTGLSVYATNALRNVLIVVGAVGMLFVTYPVLAVATCVAVPVVVAPITLASRRLRSLANRHQAVTASLSACATEVLGAMETVQSNGRESFESTRFANLREQSLSTGAARIHTHAALSSVIILGIGVVLVGVFLAGMQAVAAGVMSSGQLGQFLLYAFVAGFAAASLTEIAGELQRLRGSLSRVAILLGRQPAIEDAKGAGEGACALPICGALQLDDVSLSYRDRGGRQALSNIHLTIRPGETVAIVGPSGAGKSSLFQLLQRFREPTGGRILLDGQDIRTLPIATLRGAMAVVPQKPVLFNGSIFDNIRYGRLEATEREVSVAAQLAEAEMFIRLLPLGYMTPVGVGGATLSGGQQQRIAIARALLRQAPILLLDEATSAIDAQNERALQRAFERSRQGRTTLVIAHRLATVMSADRIIVLDQGRVVAQGTHEELMARPGLYRDLALHQGVADIESVAA